MGVVIRFIPDAHFCRKKKDVGSLCSRCTPSFVMSCLSFCVHSQQKVIDVTVQYCPYITVTLGWVAFVLTQQYYDRVLEMTAF